MGFAISAKLFVGCGKLLCFARKLSFEIKTVAVRKSKLPVLSLTTVGRISDPVSLVNTLFLAALASEIVRVTFFSSLEFANVLRSSFPRVSLRIIRIKFSLSVIFHKNTHPRKHPIVVGIADVKKRV